MRRKVKVDMAQNNFFESSGLSRNHNQLSEDLQSTEKLTKLRRAEPLQPSQVLGDSFKYSDKQLERKAKRHLDQFGISIEGKTKPEMSLKYKNFIESLLSKPNLVVHKNGTLNKQEPTINIGDPESLGITVFENNLLYNEHFFISAYKISDKVFDEFKETGNIGISPEKRKAMKLEIASQKEQAGKGKTAEQAFYSTLPEDARIGNKQLREVETLQEQLKQDPSLSLTEKEKTMLQRAEKYQEYKSQFYQNNPNIDRIEF